MSVTIDDQPENYGLITKIWGPPMWESLFCVAFGYPVNPTPQHKQNYKEFFKLLSFVLPCCMCRNSYAEYITNSSFALSDEVMISRNTLTKWLWNIKELVNNKLGKTYDETYEDICNKYESYRGKDIMTPEIKLNAYNNSKNRFAPVISYKVAERFTEYATKLGFLNYKNVLDETQKNRFATKKQRYVFDKQIWVIIDSMYANSKPACHVDGEFKDLPTLEELNLFSMRSTTLSTAEIHVILKKLGFVPNTKYSFQI